MVPVCILHTGEHTVTLDSITIHDSLPASSRVTDLGCLPLAPRGFRHTDTASCSRQSEGYQHHSNVLHELTFLVLAHTAQGAVPRFALIPYGFIVILADHDRK